jgi:hypothetical protein
MLVVLGLLIISYRETIKEYPSAGGAYLVTRDNFGIVPAQLAGAALLIGYILTVAVSVAAGSAALTSTVDSLEPYRVPIALFFIALIAYGNLRGVRESGRIFAAPTYFFMANMALLLGFGIVKWLTGDLPVLGVQEEGMVQLRRRGHWPADGRVGVRAGQGVRLRRLGRHRRRGHLQRRAGVPQAGVAQRPPDPGHHGFGPGGDVPRAVVPRVAHQGRTLRGRHTHGARPDRRGRLREQRRR